MQKFKEQEKLTTQIKMHFSRSEQLPAFQLHSVNFLYFLTTSAITEFLKDRSTTHSRILQHLAVTRDIQVLIYYLSTRQTEYQLYKQVSLCLYQLLFNGQ